MTASCSKCLDPVGLTFGEHYWGNDIKIYSKLKNTRNNVLVKNDQGQWEEQQLEPLNDDSTAVRVKELEVEYINQAAGNPIRHTTDYLLELKGGRRWGEATHVEHRRRKPPASMPFTRLAVAETANTTVMEPIEIRRTATITRRGFPCLPASASVGAMVGSARRRRNRSDPFGEGRGPLPSLAAKSSGHVA